MYWVFLLFLVDYKWGRLESCRGTKYDNNHYAIFARSLVQFYVVNTLWTRLLGHVLVMQQKNVWQIPCWTDLWVIPCSLVISHGSLNRWLIGSFICPAHFMCTSCTVLSITSRKGLKSDFYCRIWNCLNSLNHLIKEPWLYPPLKARPWSYRMRDI